MNSKGQLGFDMIVFAMAFLFAAGLFIFILVYAWGQVSPSLETVINNAIPDGQATYNISKTNDQLDTGINLFNILFPLIVVGLFLMALVFAFFTQESPIFLFIAFILLGVVVIVGVVFANVYQNITSTTEFADTADQLNVIEVFMHYLPGIMVVLTIVTMVILFGLGRGGSSGL